MKPKIYSWCMQIIHKRTKGLHYHFRSYHFFVCPPNQRIGSFACNNRAIKIITSVFSGGRGGELLCRGCSECLAAYSVRFRFKPFIPRSWYFISLKHRFIRAKLRARRQRKVRVRNQIPHAVMAHSVAVSTPIRLHLRGNSTRTAVKFFLWSRREQKAEVTFWRLKLTSVTAGTTITTRWLGRPLIPLLPHAAYPARH